MVGNKMTECPQFNTCSAPLCPLDKEIQDRLWYPDEPICKSQKYGKGVLFVKNQRKIAKRIKKENKDRYFTYDMLNRKFRITGALCGLDPDKDEKAQLERWLKKHPVLKELSEEERQKRGERLKRIRGVKKVVMKSGEVGKKVT